MARDDRRPPPPHASPLLTYVLELPSLPQHRGGPAAGPPRPAGPSIPGAAPCAGASPGSRRGRGTRAGRPSPGPTRIAPRANGPRPAPRDDSDGRPGDRGIPSQVGPRFEFNHVDRHVTAVTSAVTLPPSRCLSSPLRVGPTCSESGSAQLRAPWAGPDRAAREHGAPGGRCARPRDDSDGRPGDSDGRSGDSDSNDEPEISR